MPSRLDECIVAKREQTFEPATLTASLERFEIASKDGRTRVTLDGRPLIGVTSLDISLRPLALPVVKLAFIDFDIEGS